MIDVQMSRLSWNDEVEDMKDGSRRRREGRERRKIKQGSGSQEHAFRLPHDRDRHWGRTLDLARDALSLPVSVFITCYARVSRLSFLIEKLLASTLTILRRLLPLHLSLSSTGSDPVFEMCEVSISVLNQMTRGERSQERQVPCFNPEIVHSHYRKMKSCMSSY